MIQAIPSTVFQAILQFSKSFVDGERLVGTLFCLMHSSRVNAAAV